MTDGELVQRVLAGETQAFGRLVAKYKDAVFGVALSKAGGFADAEEIAQETFLAGAAEAYGLQFLAWCLMTHQVHLLVKSAA